MGADEDGGNVDRARPRPGLRTRPLERSLPVASSGESCKAAAEPLRRKCAAVRGTNQQPHPRRSEAQQVTQNGGGRLFPQGRSPRLQTGPHCRSRPRTTVRSSRPGGATACKLTSLAWNIRRQLLSNCRLLYPAVHCNHLFPSTCHPTRTLACARLRPLWTVFPHPGNTAPRV